MGIVFTRQRPLDLDLIRRLCVEISSQGKGLIGPSAWLSPNTVLVLGQGGTLDRFRKALSGERFNGALVRRNPHHWPPLHTPLTWQRNIPNRAAMGLFQATGGDRLPKPPILSLVTGDAGYTDYNSRDILIRWVDHPQLLWDVVYHTLAGGVEIVVHVGPEPNVVPATFERLAANISAQLGEKLLHGFGRRVISTIARSWLTQAISSKSALLRAPFLEHVVLEDWLLAQPVS
jgi:[acyl-carrier-protein] S-malonyltransferase